MNKSIKIIFNYFLGPVLFIWIAWSIWNQVIHQPHLDLFWLRIKQSFSSSGAWYLVLTFLLMMINWGIEARKWQISVALTYPISFAQAFRAILSGVSFSVSTPNRVGEYLGRMLYMPEGERLRIIPLTLIGSLSQMMVTAWMGTAALWLLRDEIIAGGIMDYRVFVPVFWIIFSGTILLTVFYFYMPSLEQRFEKRWKNKNWTYFLHEVQLFTMQRLLSILGLSTARFAVFAGQYLLLFRLFEVDVLLLEALWGISLVFMTLALIPSITLVELGIRGEASMRIIGLFSGNNLGILLASVTVWFINLVIPALAGSVLILGIKVFKKR
jgi:hypothetical protein